MENEDTWCSLTRHKLASWGNNKWVFTMRISCRISLFRHCENGVANSTCNNWATRSPQSLKSNSRQLRTLKKSLWTAVSKPVKSNINTLILLKERKLHKVEHNKVQLDLFLSITVSLHRANVNTKLSLYMVFHDVEKI